MAREVVESVLIVRVRHAAESPDAVLEMLRRGSLDDCGDRTDPADVQWDDTRILHIISVGDIEVDEEISPDISESGPSLILL